MGGGRRGDALNVCVCGRVQLEALGPGPAGALAGNGADLSSDSLRARQWRPGRCLAARLRRDVTWRARVGVTGAGMHYSTAAHTRTRNRGYDR